MASIKYVENDKYRVHFCVNRIRASKTITAKNLKDAEKQAIIMEAKLLETGSIDGKTKKEKNDLHVVDLAERYMTYLEKRPKPIAEKTRQKYQDLMNNNILPYFKGYKVSIIGVYEVEQFINFLGTPEARKRKKYNKDTYSQRTVSEIYKLFSAMMKKAVDWEIIEKNPCDKVDKPVVDKKEIIYYTEEQIVELLNLINKDTQIELNRAGSMSKRRNNNPFAVHKIKIGALSKQLIVNLAIKTAARRGEILALHREDIDLNNKIINYNKEILYTRDKGTYLQDGLKSGDSKTIPINGRLVEMISNYYCELDKLFQLSEGILKPNKRLFMTLKNNKKSKIGDMVFPDPISEWFKLFLEMHNMAPITFHKLRTSSLSYLVNNGIDLLTASKIAGHSNTHTLEKHYAGTYDSSKEIAVSKFDKLDKRID